MTNRIAQTGYVYDANGNRLEDPIRAYQWDAENRLIGVSHKSSPGRSSHFVYDGLGRRSVIEERAGLVTVGETRYAWCGPTLCQARNGSDVELRHYFEEGEHWRLQGSRLVYVRDHLGSVRGLVRAGDGALMGAHDYDPYGRLISVSGSYPGEFGYAGMHHHVSSGLWLTRYRAYDSQTARWLSRDPIEEEGGVNLYGYVLGNPISYTDPLGLEVQFCCAPVEVGWIPDALAGILPKHCWLKTDTYESGMGADCPVPGQQCSDKPGADTTTKDHGGQSANRKGAECTPLKNIDEQCVNERIKPGPGTWHPYNQCQSFAAGVMGQCRYGPNMGPSLPPPSR